jgi:hypothetical protein
MQAPTFSAFTASVDAQAIAMSPVLDRMAVRYFVLPPDQVSGERGAVPAADGAVRVPAGGSAGCTLPAQPLRGVQVSLAEALRPVTNAAGMTLRITVRDGERTQRSGRFASGPIAAGAQVAIGLAGEDIRPGGTLQVAVSVDGAAGPMTLAATGGAVRCVPIAPADDGLKLVYADPASVIYLRSSALPRIRWAGTGLVLTDSSSRLATLGTGVAPGTVVLSEPGPRGSGAPADVRVTEDSGDRISARVDAHGAGYLVVADALQRPGWSVRVDGHPAKLVAADAAMGAVLVPAGTHEVTFSYTVPGQVTGAAISLASLLTLLGLLAWELRRRRIDRRRPAAAPPAAGEAVGAVQVVGETR